MRARENSIGAWAYAIGVVIAIVVGLIVAFQLNVPNYNTISMWAAVILIVLGVLIGYAHDSSSKDSNTFLMAGVILVLVSNFGANVIQSGILVTGFIGRGIISIFNSLLLLFVPATIIVALKTLFGLIKV